MVDFPTCRNSKRYSVNWKWNMSVFGKRLSQTSPYIFLQISLVFNFKQNTACRNPLNSQSPFFLWCKETARESMAVQLFHMEEKLPALSTAGSFLHCQREATHKWHPVGISAGLPYPEDFRTYLTHLHGLPLPFVSGKRPKLKWKLMWFLTSVLFMFVSFSPMHSVYYSKLKIIMANHSLAGIFNGFNFSLSFLHVISNIQCFMGLLSLVAFAVCAWSSCRITVGIKNSPKTNRCWFHSQAKQHMSCVWLV